MSTREVGGGWQGRWVGADRNRAYRFAGCRVGGGDAPMAPAVGHACPDQGGPPQRPRTSSRRAAGAPEATLAPGHKAMSHGCGSSGGTSRCLWDDVLGVAGLV